MQLVEQFPALLHHAECFAFQRRSSLKSVENASLYPGRVSDPGPVYRRDISYIRQPVFRCYVKMQMCIPSNQSAQRRILLLTAAVHTHTKGIWRWELTSRILHRLDCFSIKFFWKGGRMGDMQGIRLGYWMSFSLFFEVPKLQPTFAAQSDFNWT